MLFSQLSTDGSQSFANMKCAAVCILVCLALASPALALLRPLFPVKAAPPFRGEVIVIGDDFVRDGKPVEVFTYFFYVPGHSNVVVVDLDKPLDKQP